MLESETSFILQFSTTISPPLHAPSRVISQPSVPSALLPPPAFPAMLHRSSAPLIPSYLLSCLAVRQPPTSSHRLCLRVHLFAVVPPCHHRVLVIAASSSVRHHPILPSRLLVHCTALHCTAVVGTGGETRREHHSTWRGRSICPSPLRNKHFHVSFPVASSVSAFPAEG